MGLLAGIALVGIILIAGLGQYLTGKVFEATNYNTVNTVPSIVALGDIRENILRGRIRVDRLVLNTNAAASADIEKSAKDAFEQTKEAFKKYEALLSDAKDKEFLDKEKVAFDKFLSEIEKVFAEVRANNRDKAREYLEISGKTARDLDSIVNEHLGYNEALGKKAADEAIAIRSQSSYL